MLNNRPDLIVEIKSIKMNNSFLYVAKTMNVAKYTWFLQCLSFPASLIVRLGPVD